MSKPNVRDIDSPDAGAAAARRPETENPGEPAAADSANASAPGQDEKNEKVLHTRISPTLDREIKRRARGLGMSVSTVVRNVLLNTFDLVEDIVNDSANVAASISGDEPSVRPTARRGLATAVHGATPHDTGATDGGKIIGWQRLTLNLNAVCERCNAIITKGDDGAVAVHEIPGPRSIICLPCLESIGDGT